MNRTWKNGEKPNFMPPNFFSWILPLLYVWHCRKLSLYVIANKTYHPNARKWRKTAFWAWAHWAQIQAAKFFFKYLTSSVTRYHGHLSSCKISEKTKDQILRELSDRRMDKQTDRQKDESDLIGRCPNVECPMKKITLLIVWIFYLTYLYI